MAINDAMFTGVQNILSAYENLAETPFYSVWKGKDLLFQFNEADSVKGYEKLKEQLLAAEQNNNRDILKIKIHPVKAKPYITDVTPHIATMYIRVCAWDSQQYSNNLLQSNTINDKVLETLNGINSRLVALEEEEEIEEVETDQFSKISGVIGTVSSLLEHPLIAGIVSKFINMPNAQPAAAISGINNTYDSAVDLLRRVDPDFENDICKLAEIAEKKPLAFKLLIAELREFKV